MQTSSFYLFFSHHHAENFSFTYIVYVLFITSSSHLSFLTIRFIPNLPQVVASMAANYAPATAAPPAASSPFSWVPRQMLSGDAAEEDGDSDDSDRGDEDRGEGDEAELVIDIPNE